MPYHSPFPDVAIPEVALTTFVFQPAHRADKPAVIDGVTGRVYTYGQLAEAIRRAAFGLSRRGFRKGEVFAFYSPNLPEYVVAFHAVLTLGGVVTTVNPLYTADELAHQLRDAGARFLLTVPPLLPQALQAAEAAGVEEVFVFGIEGATPFATLLQDDGPIPPVVLDVYQDVAVLPYSSGTMGLPKGVMLTHHNLVANVCQVSAVAGLREDDVGIALLPFYHIYGIFVFMNLAMYTGTTIVTMPRFDLETFLQTMQRQEVTIAYLVPPIIQALARHPMVAQYPLPKLRQIVSGAAPLPEAIAHACAARLRCEVVQGYGMTETSPVTHYMAEGRMVRRTSVGMAVPNTAFCIMNLATGEPLPPGQPGEVWVRGPQVMKGYLNNPQATALMIDPDGWLHTGDVGQVDEEGYLYIVDRVKELIKYKGMQVAPAELEAVLQAHPAVADAAVIGVPDDEAGEVPKAFIVLKPGAQTTAEALMAFVAERVAPYKKVRRVVFVEAIPKVPSGKILRRKLIELEQTVTA